MQEKYYTINETNYPATLPAHLIERLERHRQSNTRLRIFYGNIETGEVWHEEFQIQGRIVRSTGTVKIPLLINNARSYGGGALSGSIVAVKISGTKTWIYKHDKLHFGTLIANDREVTHNGVAVARFANNASAKRYVDFLLGNRDSK